ncbi:MAG: hypothetical protein KGK44_09480 [Gammaproteobacteria bacterium]|nr:hypothetical protein [Gammaproteobacteria bacterium]
MRISTQLRQTLISTGSVGAFFGLLCALGSFAFYSDYNQHIASAPRNTWENLLNAFDTFLWITVGIVVAFGLLPSAITWSYSKLFRKSPNSKPSEQ